MTKALILATLLFLQALSFYAYARTPDETVVDIIVTSQKHDHASPWQKGQITRSKAAGCVIDGRRIVTSAYSIADSVLLEVMKKGESRKYAARAEILDYHTGLAILKVRDEGFFEGLRPAELATADRMIGRAARVYSWDSLSSMKEYTAELAKTSIRLFEPSCGVLMHQFSTSMNEGGNGEPVFVDGMLAGIATGLNAETKTLYVLSAEVLRRMLRDAGEGGYDGVPFFWIESSEIQSNSNLRTFFGMAEGEGGVLVTGVPPASSGGDVLKTGDIILSVDGHALDDNGMYDSPYGKLYYVGLIQMNRFVGETVAMKVLRNGKRVDIAFRLKPVPVNCCHIPLISTGLVPRYMIFGGLVFQELTLGYLEAFGPEWKQRADKRLLYYYDNVKALSSEKGMDRIVVMSRVLPDPVNRGYQQLNNLLLGKVNGTQVRSIPHLKKLLDGSRERFAVFEFEGATTVVIDRDGARKGEAGLLKNYNITMPFSVTGD